MMTLNANKQKLSYALLIKEVAVNVLDEDGNPVVSYVDEDGNIYYAETGEPELIYSEPVSFFANIAFSGGEAQAQEYGVDISAYDAVLIVGKNEISITETSLVWFESEVKHTTIMSDNKIIDIIDRHTADFKVLAIKPSLNQIKVILGRITK